MQDLLIRNATMVDLASGREFTGSVEVRMGRIANVYEDDAPGVEAREVVDADGKYLFPGFVDYHTHLFAHGSMFGMDANLLFSSGVTAAADMGSAGWVNFPAMYDLDMAGKKPRLTAYINVSPVGQPGRGVSEPLDDELFMPDEIRRLMREYPGVITGLKVRLSKGIVKDLGIRPLERTVELGEELGLPVCVHTTNPPETMDRIASILRPGDILSHTYHGSGHTSAESEEVLAGMLAAKARGVVIEVGNGSKNFNFKSGEKCLAAGLTPDIISSDATPTVFHNSPACWDLARVTSKFMNLGMPLAEAVRAVTETPARVLFMDNVIGRIAPGYEADLALFDMDRETVISYYDSDNAEKKGYLGLVPAMTIRSGQIVWKK